MTLYDRDYLRNERNWQTPSWMPSTMLGRLILVNAVVFVLNLLLTEQPRQDFGSVREPINQFLTLPANFFQHPWQVWKLVTYGFAHGGLGHLFFNMFGLWIFGRTLESLYGPKEFLRFYLAAIVFSALGWLLVNQLFPSNASGMLGASGAVMAVVMLFVLRFPQERLYLFGAFPIPAWVLGAAYLFMDLRGAINGQDNIAYTAHLAGALFALIYFRTNLNLARLDPSHWDWPQKLYRRLRGQAALKAYRPPPDDEDDQHYETRMQRQVDEILAKISTQGEASLSSEERRILTEASRRYQQRRR